MSDADSAIVYLARWASAAKADDAADRRVQEQWARAQAEDEATLASVLAGLVERRAPVAVHVRTGSTVRGTAVGLGNDYLALAHGGQLSLFPAAAIEWVRPDGGGGPAAFSDRAAPTGSLAGILGHVVEERLAVRVATSTESLVGELVAVGADVLTLRPSGAPPDQLVYVPIPAVVEVSLRL